MPMYLSTRSLHFSHTEGAGLKYIRIINVMQKSSSDPCAQLSNTSTVLPYTCTYVYIHVHTTRLSVPKVHMYTYV